ncbi:MAG: Asp-tRNA(Asn)/Glu-tRNA(Gln) amidotransferase subunit GatA [bacterium]|nr:Asp-tRNA(Asn)/Glu-tRNA(Gln) amidotransferase subunit GatA [bacterium]
MNPSPTSASQTAAAVRSKARSALSVVEEHLAVIGQSEEEICAFNIVTADKARSRAAQIDAQIAQGHNPGPLAGVPVAIKDNLCTKGIPTTCSSRILEGWEPPYDATAVELLCGAGAVIIGKTNMDEFAMGSSTENSAFRPTRNPQDTSKVPGGSSGGSAAAVAAGFAPIALGTDTGGSIRQPAALCGVVGVKPTYGRVSRYGLIAFASSLDQIGPFANTVADAALVTDVIAQFDSRDSTSISQPVADVLPTLDHGVAGVRIGVIKELGGKGIAPDVAARCDQAIGALESAGAKVGQASVPSAGYGLSAYYLIAPAEASSNLARFDGVRYGLRVDAKSTPEMNIATRSAGFGEEVKRRIMLGTYALSSGYYDAYYAKAQKVRTLIIADFAKAWEDFDLLLSPTSPTTAFSLGERTSDPMAMYMSDVCTVPVNLTGQAAMSVPYGCGQDGLPVGVQILAPALGEPLMFRAAAVLEASLG